MHPPQRANRTHEAEWGTAKATSTPTMLQGIFVRAENLPDLVRGNRFYEPGELGAERQIAERLRDWWGERFGAREDSEDSRNSPS